MKQEFRTWLLVLLLWLLAGLAICFSFTQEQISVWVNSMPGLEFDPIAKYLTWFGDGWMIVALCIALFAIDKRLAWFLLLSYALSSGFTQLLKHTLFSDFHRPMHYLAENKLIHLVEGVEINYHNSFPSGHTTAAFAFFMGIALWKNKPGLTFILLMVSIVVGLTRVYLMQHFFRDVLAGSMVGSLIAFACLYLVKTKRDFWPFKFKNNA